MGVLPRLVLNGLAVAGLLWRLRGKGAAVGFEVDQGRAVDTIEPLHMQHATLDPQQSHDRGADRVWPCRRAQRKGADRPPIAARALAGQVAAALVQPIQNLDRAIGIEPVQRILPDRIKLDPAFRSIEQALPRAVRPCRPRRANPANKADGAIRWRLQMDNLFILAQFAVHWHQALEKYAVKCEAAQWATRDTPKKCQ